MELFDEIGEVLKGKECKHCPWYKHCVAPVSIPDIQNTILSNVPPELFKNAKVEQVAQRIQETVIVACPVFTERLKKSPNLIQAIKKLMENWKPEEM